MTRHRTGSARAGSAIVVLGAVLLVGGAWTISNGAREDGAAPAGTRARLLRAERVSALADGHVLIGGVSERKRGGEGPRGCDGESAVVELDARGKLDAGFGDRGSARVRPDDNDCVSSVDQLVRGADGHVFVGMTIFHPSDSAVDDNSSQRGGLIRLTPQGRVDDSFKGQLSGFRFAKSSDGSIVDELGARYLPNGDSDPRDERTRVRIGVDLAVDVAAQPDGKTLFLGLQDRANYRRLAVQRFDPGWEPDTTFGKDGTATADVAPGKRLEATQPELQRVLPAPNGAAIAFGLAFGPRRPYAFAIKFDAAGDLDRSFGDRGRVEIGPPKSSKEVYDVTARPDGSLIAIGSVGAERTRRLFVARYNPDGTPDLRFGRAGRATLGFLRPPRSGDPSELNRGNRAGAITPGPAGTTLGVASLTAVSGSATKSLVFRLRRNGALDPGFGHRGVKLIQRLG